MNFNKITKAGIGIVVGAIALAAIICIISISLYGKVYFFDGYQITAIAWTLVIIGLPVGIITVIAGFLDGFVYQSNSGKELKMKKVWIIIVILAVLFLVSECSNDGTVTYYIDKNGNGKADLGEGVYYEDKNGTHFFD